MSKIKRGLHVSAHSQCCLFVFLAGLGSGTTDSLFDAQNKPQTGFRFGSNTGSLGTSASSTAASSTSFSLGAKPAVLGTGTAFGGSTGGTGLLRTTGILGTGTGLNTGTLRTS